MFTEEELEGVQGAQLEEWLQDHEADLRLIAENRQFVIGDPPELVLRNLIALLDEVYWLRRTYA